VAFSPDGQTIVSGSKDKTLKLWDTSGNFLDTLSGHQDDVTAVAFSPDGQTIVSGSKDKTLKLWNTSGNLLDTLSGHQEAIYAVAFSPDGKTIVSGSDDNTLKLWDTSGNLLDTLSGHQEAIYAVAFSPDGKFILSGSRDKTLKLWNTSGNLLDTLSGHEDDVTAVAFSPDGQTIVSGSRDKTLKLWNTSGNLLDTFSGHQEAIYAVAFSPDGKFILSGSWDKTLKLWDTSGNLLHTFSGHEDAVFAVAFSSDGKRIVSGSWDKTLKLWHGGNWQYLLQVGCERLRLHPQLASPDNDKAGATCLQYGGWKETEQAEFLVKQGKAIAQEQQDVNTAIKKFKQAKRLDPDYQLTSLETEAKKLAAPGLVTQGETLLEEDKIKEALSYYQKAQQFDPNLQILAESWNSLCFYGSLNRFEVEVMFACDKAVKLAPQESKARYQANRGIAKALTGDKTGAIEDLEAYVNSSDISDEYQDKWQGWIQELEAGKNPFTDEVLQDLRNTE
jgi:WD40 repeat protein